MPLLLARALQVAIAVSVITVGTGISSYGELAFSLLGFLMVVVSGAHP
jgi:hypothetical protein